MKRTTINLYIDLLAAAFFIGMIATGYILYFTMPPGTNKSLSLWSLPRHQWGQIHFWISTGLLALFLTHVALHWQWVVVTLSQRFGLERQNPKSRHLRSGAITLVVTTAGMALFAWITAISVRERQDPPYRQAEVYGGEGHGDLEGTELSPTRAGQPIDFWMEVYPIFEASCIRCHGQNGEQAGFRADRREDYLGTAETTAIVVKGKSAESPLIAIVTGQRPEMAMANSHRLSEPDIAILRAWIDAGAEWPEKHVDR